jgi:hypothetical protein
MVKLFIFLVILILFYVYSPIIEGYNMGALTQLFAKGPQDSYLTETNGYYYPYMPYPRQMIWNNPTRLQYGYPFGLQYRYPFGLQYGYLPNQRY